MSARMKLNKNSPEREILIALVVGAIILSPMGGKVAIALAKYYLKKWWDEGGPYIPPENDPEQVRQSIYKLKRNNYIKWKYDKSKNVYSVELTEKGKKAFDKTRFDDITMVTPGEWDGQWRFLIFDIPEKRKIFRDILRAKLKHLGFFQFQKSVWVYPFECEEEIRYICEYLRIMPYAIMFTAKIERDRVLRRYFLKQGILLRRYLTLFDKGIRY